MITTWLKIWAEQASSRTERKQRFALIKETFPSQRSNAFRSAGRRSMRTGRDRHAFFEEVTT